MAVTPDVEAHKSLRPSEAAAANGSPTKWFLGIFLAASLAMIFPSAGARETRAEGTSRTEKWIVARAAAGEIADLSKRFPEEKDRKLSAHFLEKLLTVALPGFKPHRNGVRIIGAIIDEPIDLTDTQIPCPVWLANCQFMSSATFQRASFARTALFDGSAFKAGTDFGTMKVGGTAFFRKAVFEGPVNFTSADIARNFEADEAQFKNEEQTASFNSMKVGHIAFFRKAVFEGPVNFVGVNIADDFTASEAKFKNKEQTATFDSMKVRGSAVFNKAVFEGPVNFDSADIASALAATEAQFKNTKQGGSFNTMKVGGNAVFTKAIFEGPVVFTAAHIAGQFIADEAQFKNKEQTAIFNGMKVGHHTFFKKAVFEGPVDFRTADIAGQFIAEEAQFKNKEQTAIFDRMKIGGAAFFTDAVFAGPVAFIEADFAGQFGADDAQFKNKEQGANFSSMKVAGTAFFKKAAFEGPVDLSFSDFAALDLSEAVYAGALYLQGMSYKKILAAPKEPESHQALLMLADKSAYTADVYGNLEEFFKRQGYRADADRAFIEGKRRERKEYLHGFGWLGSLLLDWLVGYGRHPSHAGYFCAFFVALGCFLFSPKRMEPQKPDDAPRVYNRFWYSLGLFLPFVDLQADKVWKPKPDQTFLRNYMRVHVLPGWILVPLVLAALTGLIK